MSINLEAQLRIASIKFDKNQLDGAFDRILGRISGINKLSQSLQEVGLSSKESARQIDLLALRLQQANPASLKKLEKELNATGNSIESLVVKFLKFQSAQDKFKPLNLTEAKASLRNLSQEYSRLTDLAKDASDPNKSFSSRRTDNEITKIAKSILGITGPLKKLNKDQKLVFDNLKESLELDFFKQSNKNIEENSRARIAANKKEKKALEDQERDSQKKLEAIRNQQDRELQKKIEQQQRIVNNNERVVDVTRTGGDTVVKPDPILDKIARDDTARARDDARIAGEKRFQKVVEQTNRKVSTEQKDINKLVEKALSLGADKNRQLTEEQRRVIALAQAYTKVNSARVALGRARGSATVEGFDESQIRQLKTGLQDINKQTQSLNSTKATLTSFGEAAGLAVKRYSAFLVGSFGVFQLISFFSQSAQQFIELERSLTKIQQVLGATDAKVKSLNGTIRDLSATLGVAATDLSEGVFQFAQAGFTNIEKELIPLANQLAKIPLTATFGSIEQTVEGLLAVFGQFNLEASETGRILDLVNKFAADFAVESQDIFEGIKRGGAAFSTAGGDVEEFISLFSVLRERTRESAATLGTFFKTGLAQVLQPSSQQELRQLGINSTDLVEQLLQLSDTLFEPGRFSSNQRINITRELTGLRQFSRLLALLEEFQNEDTRSRVENALSTASGSLDASLGARLDDVGTSINRIRESFNQLFGELADNQGLRQFAKNLADFANGLRDVFSEIKPLIPLITTLAGLKIGQSVLQVIGAGAGKLGLNNVAGIAGGVGSLGRGGRRNLDDILFSPDSRRDFGGRLRRGLSSVGGRIGGLGAIAGTAAITGSIAQSINEPNTTGSIAANAVSAGGTAFLAGSLLGGGPITGTILAIGASVFSIASDVSKIREQERAQELQTVIGTRTVEDDIALLLKRGISGIGTERLPTGRGDSFREVQGSFSIKNFEGSEQLAASIIKKVFRDIDVQSIEDLANDQGLISGNDINSLVVKTVLDRLKDSTEIDPQLVNQLFTKIFTPDLFDFKDRSVLEAVEKVQIEFVKNLQALAVTISSLIPDFEKFRNAFSSIITDVNVTPSLSSGTRDDLVTAFGLGPVQTVVENLSNRISSFFGVESPIINRGEQDPIALRDLLKQAFGTTEGTEANTFAETAGNPRALFAQIAKLAVGFNSEGEGATATSGIDLNLVNDVTNQLQKIIGNDLPLILESVGIDFTDFIKSGLGGGGTEAVDKIFEAIKKREEEIVQSQKEAVAIFNQELALRRQLGESILQNNVAIAQFNKEIQELEDQLIDRVSNFQRSSQGSSFNNFTQQANILLDRSRRNFGNNTSTSDLSADILEQRRNLNILLEEAQRRNENPTQFDDNPEFFLNLNESQLRFIKIQNIVNERFSELSSKISNAAAAADLFQQAAKQYEGSLQQAGSAVLGFTFDDLKSGFQAFGKFINSTTLNGSQVGTGAGFQAAGTGLRSLERTEVDSLFKILQAAGNFNLGGGLSGADILGDIQSAIAIPFLAELKRIVNPNLTQVEAEKSIVDELSKVQADALNALNEEKTLRREGISLTRTQIDLAESNNKFLEQQLEAVKNIGADFTSEVEILKKIQETIIKSIEESPIPVSLDIRGTNPLGDDGSAIASISPQLSRFADASEQINASAIALRQTIEQGIITTTNVVLDPVQVNVNVQGIDKGSVGQVIREAVLAEVASSLSNIFEDDPEKLSRIQQNGVIS